MILAKFVMFIGSLLVMIKYTRVVNRRTIDILSYKTLIWFNVPL